MKTDLTKNIGIKHTFTYMSKHIGGWALIIAIMCAAFWIRIQGVDTIPDGQFNSNDAYLHYWQAQIVSDQGHLPARDMDRWVPLGRDNTQMLSLYAYAAAYTHKAITFLFPNVSLYSVMLYAPVFCFAIGLGVLCLFLYHAFGTLFSGIVGILLATLPGTIDRSVAGFSDRDSWCLMLGVIAVTTYLAALQMQNTRKRLIFTLASGITCFLGGLSWEGFGVFLFVILFVEIWRFLTSETEEGLGHYLIWVLTFVPMLSLVSPVYQRGEWFATHMTAFVLIPPLALLVIRALRHFLLTKTSLNKKLQPHARTAALGLTLASFIFALGYVLSQLGTFDLTIVPFNESNLMQSVGELHTPEYNYWVFRYGSIFFLGCIGLIMTSIYLWERKCIILILPIILFTLTTFFREQLDKFGDVSLGGTLFLVSIACTILGLLLIAWLRKERAEHELVFIAFAVWFLCWIALSRDARRYDFFIGISIAFFTAAFFRSVSEVLCAKLNTQSVFQRFIKTSITVALLAILMWWTPAGAHARRSVFAARHMRSAIPGYTSIEKTFRWMKAQLPNSACVAASWSHGSQLNVLGGVKTVIDQDHYIQHWIHLSARHVFCAQSDTEALEFLKTHEATHLMLTSKDLFQFARIHSSVGSNAQRDREFQFTPLRMNLNKNGIPFLVPIRQDTSFTHINIKHNETDASPITATVNLENGSTVEVPYIGIVGERRIHSEKPAGSETGGIILFFNKHKQFKGGFYVPPIGWNSLAVRLFFRGESSEIFVPVYPEDGDVTAEVKVWEINYPPDVKSNPKYLETESSE